MALNILLSECEVKRAELINYTQNLLQYFVRNCCYFYGESFTVYNIHGLLHMSEDIRQFGCYLNLGFPFVNYLQLVKKAVKNAKNPTAQIIKRLQLHEAMNQSYTPKLVIVIKIYALLVRAD